MVFFYQGSSYETAKMHKQAWYLDEFGWCSAEAEVGVRLLSHILRARSGKQKNSISSRIYKVFSKDTPIFLQGTFQTPTNQHIPQIPLWIKEKKYSMEKKLFSAPLRACGAIESTRSAIRSRIYEAHYQYLWRTGLVVGKKDCQSRISIINAPKIAWLWNLIRM